MQADTVSQKRTGTVLFADVAGFTAFAERIGEEAAFEMIRDVSSRMQNAIRDHSGTVGEFRGDGIMALFSVTEGLENGPLRACQAALQIREGIAGAEAEMKKRYGAAPRVRVGLHCGPLVVGDVSGGTKAHVTIIGDTANTASRLESMAEPGQVVISRDLFALVEGQVDATDLGPHRMKGKAQPMQVYALNAVNEGVSRFDAARSRGLSTFFDREAEIAALNESLAHARSGKTAVALVEGEPGIGKSRLLYEFEQSLPEDEVRLHKGECRADGATVPYLPFAELVRTALRLKPEATPDEARAQVARMIEVMGFDPDRTRPYLMTLLGKAADDDAQRGESPDMIGARIRQVLIDLIEYSCAQSPMVLVIEDLHWADPGTVQLLETLIEEPRDWPLMIIGTFRPGFRQEWYGRSHVTHITPSPISEDAVTALIREVMSGSDRADDMAALAIQKADGNPLYAEEIAKFLVQQRENAGGATGEIGDIVLPTNLQNMVMERFDRLGAECRMMLQAASAIGRRFDAQIASQVAQKEPPISITLLEEAVEVDLIRPTATGYEFKHALVQDAIYDTLLRGPRKTLHAAIAEELAHRYSNRPEEAAEGLAHHYDKADKPEQAVPHLIAAGQRNLSLFSLNVAEDFFARAFELVTSNELPLTSEKVAGLFSGWFEVQQWHAEFGRSIRLFEAERERIETAASSPAQYARILGLVGVAYTQDMQFDKARPLFDEAIAIGERTNDRAAITDGCLGLMVLNCTQPRAGSWEDTQSLAERIHTLWGDDAQPYHRTYCDFYQNWSHSIRGDIDFALENGKALYEKGREMQFSGAIGWGAICIAFNNAYNENYERAIEIASIGAEEGGGMVDKLVCLGLKGLSMVLNGDVKGGAAILDDIFAQRGELDFRGIENIVDGPVGLAKALGGDLAGGVSWINDAIERARSGGNMHGAAMSHISLGTLYLLLATGDEKPDFKTLARNAIFLLRNAPFAKSKAIAHFDAALEMGRAAGMHGVVAQAAHGKGLALKAARKIDKARAALTEAKEAVGRIRWSMMANRIETDLAALG
ncbi:MAG: AAA family ATPase [Sulfitobacter sp.]|nr:AAA family ATPase [Sulfitobacter sp.]